MKRFLAACAMVAVWACLGWGETISFPGGSVDVVWSEDGLLSIQVSLASRPPAGGATLMWVLTANALRFADGIHSWQLHVSPTHASIVVVPNDFLTTQRFTFEQLGIRIEEHEAGRLLRVVIPRSGAIPELVAPGDTLEVHALWIQQAPLTGVRISEPPILVPYVPAETVYTRGTTIRHSFTLVDTVTGAPYAAGAATIGLVRTREGAADEIVRYIYREPDAATGVLTYEFDTMNLPAGSYSLIVWVQPLDITVRQDLEIVDPIP